MTRKRILFGLRLTVSVALIAFLGYQLYQEGAAAWPPVIVSTAALVVALVLVPVSVFVRTLNFSILVNEGSRVMHLGQAAYLTLVGQAAAMFLPAGAGDLVKAHVGYRAYGAPEKVVVSSVIDKLTSLVAVAVLGVIGGIATGEALLGGVSAIVAVVSGAMVVYPRIIPWKLLIRVTTPGVEICTDTLAQATRPSAWLLTKVLALSFIGWALSYAILYAICVALGIDVSVGDIYVMAPFMTMSTLIPISLGGIGLGQVTLVYLLTRLGVPDTLAVQAAFIHLATIMLVALAGAVLFAIRGARSNKQNDQ